MKGKHPCLAPASQESQPARSQVSCSRSTCSTSWARVATQSTQLRMCRTIGQIRSQGATCRDPWHRGGRTRASASLKERANQSAQLKLCLSPALVRATRETLSTSTVTTAEPSPTEEVILGSRNLQAQQRIGDQTEACTTTTTIARVPPATRATVQSSSLAVRTKAELPYKMSKCARRKLPWGFTKTPHNVSCSLQAILNSYACPLELKMAGAASL